MKIRVPTPSEAEATTARVFLMGDKRAVEVGLAFGPNWPARPIYLMSSAEAIELADRLVETAGHATKENTK